MPHDPTEGAEEQPESIEDMLDSWRPEGSGPMRKVHRFVVEIDTRLSDRCAGTFLEPMENLIHMKVGELLEEGTPLDEEGEALKFSRVKRNLGIFGMIKFWFASLFSRPVYIPDEPDMATKSAWTEEDEDGKTGTAANNLPAPGGALKAPAQG
jgi:hypothetical protein